MRFCPSSPRPPSPTRGEGGVWASRCLKREKERRGLPKHLPPSSTRGEGRFGRPEAQNEIGNAGASQEPAPVRRGRPALAGRQGRDARAPNADETPAIPGGAGCPRSQAGRDARVPGMRARRPRSQVGQDARAPRHAGETPALPGEARCSRSRHAGETPALPSGAGCPRPWHAVETPAPSGGAGTRTASARQEYGL